LFSTDFLMIYYRYGLISGMFTVMYVMIAVNIMNVFWQFYKEVLQVGRECPACP